MSWLFGGKGRNLYSSIDACGLSAVPSAERAGVGNQFRSMTTSPEAIWAVGLKFGCDIWAANIVLNYYGEEDVLERI
jgi:hypothetical protein